MRARAVWAWQERVGGCVGLQGACTRAYVDPECTYLDAASQHVSVRRDGKVFGRVQHAACRVVPAIVCGRVQPEPFDGCDVLRARLCANVKARLARLFGFGTEGVQRGPCFGQPALPLHKRGDLIDGKKGTLGAFARLDTKVVWLAEISLDDVIRHVVECGSVDGAVERGRALPIPDIGPDRRVHVHPFLRRPHEGKVDAFPVWRRQESLLQCAVLE